MASSIYIHLPFCKTKCPYCDFASFAVANNYLSEDRSKYQEYIDALCKEIELRAPNNKQKDKQEIKTIFFGGGTPSVHNKEELAQVFKKLREHFVFADDIEVTLEANPGTIDKAKLEAFKGLGVNRISIGAQSFDAPLLEKLGRGHSLEDTYQVIQDIVDTNFESWSFDLIYGLPNQSLASWQDTVDKALSFNPLHISIYALSIEKGTPYGDIYKDSSHESLPQEEEVLAMYEYVHKKLEENKILRYEISNWAKQGHEAKHNLTYWNADEYYAFGLSAHGYLEGYRYSNTRDLAEYISTVNTKPKALLLGDENLNKRYINTAEKLEEQILLKMRLNNGLSLNSDAAKFLNKQSLELLLDQSFVEKFGDSIRLTTKGILVSNTVIANLIGD